MFLLCCPVVAIDARKFHWNEVERPHATHRLGNARSHQFSLPIKRVAALVSIVVAFTRCHNQHIVVVVGQRPAHSRIENSVVFYFGCNEPTEIHRDWAVVWTFREWREKK